ncbi:hypothetical protein BHE74_00034598 [Ensete ventricosum]|nr:hypothetical protein BHE74_00034598 [Ensete ventricosum]
MAQQGLPPTPGRPSILRCPDDEDLRHSLKTPLGPPGGMPNLPGPMLTASATIHNNFEPNTLSSDSTNFLVPIHPGVHPRTLKEKDGKARAGYPKAIADPSQFHLSSDPGERAPLNTQHDQRPYSPRTPRPLRQKAARILAPPQGLVEKQIDVIVGGPTSRGDNSSVHKAYARAPVEKRPRRERNPEITFGSEK